MNVEPLYGLRLRTPRLELHVPTADELEALYEVAAAGIHPPEVMPFAVAWTDDLTRDRFIAYHCDMRESWTPESWNRFRRLGRRRAPRRAGNRREGIR